MKKKYFISGLVVAVILLIVFLVKGMYPFGKNYIMWGDMYEQIVPLYYNFYDVIRNGKSILIDYTGGIASSFIPNFFYYISSPFTLLVLLFKRSDIPNAVNIIVLLKIVLSTVTCNYFLDKKFKKLDDFYKCFFSIIYGLSTYNLSLYIITGWIDIVYLFPLLMLGLDELLNLKKPKLFIIILSMSLIFNFYISLMCILFIFFISIIYLKIYKNQNIRKAITSLGLSVLLSLLISSIALIPVFLQILSSARMGVNFSQLGTSKFGPIIDKLMFLTSSMAPIACILLLFRKYRQNKANITFIIMSLLLLGLPILIEPINKMLHFGSYVCYPYRYGFILMFMLSIFSCMYLNSEDEENHENKLLIIISTIISVLLIGIISYKYYPILQEGVNKLSFSFNHKAFFLIVALALLNLISYFVIFRFGNKKSKFSKAFLMINLLVFCLSQSFIYVGIDRTSKEFYLNYNNMDYISALKTETGYHYKQDNSGMISNFGAITNKQTQDYFTSLTNNDVFIEYQKLGYNSYYTSSTGGNYFSDFILSNKYYITRNKVDEEYYKLYKTNGNLNIYEATLPISKGYVLKKNKSLKDVKNSFEATNIIYKAVSNSQNEIINIYNDFELENVKYDGTKLEIIDKSKEAYISKEFDINDAKTLYLEAFTSYVNIEKNKLYNCFDIYVNDELLFKDFYNRDNNSVLNLGTFNNEKVEVKVLIKKDIPRNVNISIGLLDRNLLRQYFENNKYEVGIDYKNNDLNITYKSDNEDILFIPIPYLKGMSATQNGHSTEIIKVFDDFIGVRLKNGENNIKISYITSGLKTSILLSILGIIGTLLFIKFYEKITDCEILNRLTYITYLVLYIILLLIFYIIPLFIFILSFI